MTHQAGQYRHCTRRRVVSAVCRWYRPDPQAAQ
ncbi:hypothetical protein KIPB_016416, partial [Kipferlia bialata]|eukprot:g16416.t1